MPNTGTGRYPKAVEIYEQEAEWVDGCLIHPAQAVARRVYKKRHGPLPSKVLVCHTCDNPQCILDEHHWLGSHSDNMSDKMAKGRWRGGCPPKITDRQVLELRRCKDISERRQMATALNITDQAAIDIISKRRRRNVL